MKWIISALILAVSLVSPLVQAEQSKEIGQLEVHYIAFPSTFITPEIASQYQISRSAYNGLINITVLDKMQNGKPAITGILQGRVRNLLGNSNTLNFREIKEGDAVYYIAEFRISDQETYIFDIDINAEGNRSGKLTFNQKFYVDD